MADKQEISVPLVELVDLWQIILQDIKQFDNSKDLLIELDKMKNDNDVALKQFKDLIIQLTEDLAAITNDNLLNKYKKDIIKTINSNPKKVIDTFIMKGYNHNNGFYRKQLMLCNEDFFLNDSFSDVTKGDFNIIDKLFKFKSFWNKLKQENKDIIKYYLITLCSLADIRYINFNRYIEIKKMSNLHKSYKTIFNMYDKII
jgi:hypothetical protein